MEKSSLDSFHLIVSVRRLSTWFSLGLLAGRGSLGQRAWGARSSANPCPKRSSEERHNLLRLNFQSIKRASKPEGPGRSWNGAGAAAVLAPCSGLSLSSES